MSAATPLAVRLVFIIALGKRLFLQQRLTVRHRNLVVIRMNFREGEEPVAVAAIIDEGCLERRLYPRYFGEVYVAPQRSFACRLEVEFFDATTS